MQSASRFTRHMRSVIIGRFIPPHKGHLYLINNALANSSTLHLFLCTLANDPIPGTLRAHWIKEIYREARKAKNLNLIIIDEENEAATRNAPNAPQLWAESVLKHIRKPIDMIYSSETYGAAFAKHLNASYTCVDLKRAHIPISAMDVRKDPLRYWKFIPPIVRPYFALRHWKNIHPKNREKHLIVVQSRTQYIAQVLAEYFNTHATKHPDSRSMKCARVFLFCYASDITSMIQDPDNYLPIPYSHANKHNAIEYIQSLLHAAH